MPLADAFGLGLEQIGRGTISVLGATPENEILPLPVSGRLKLVLLQDGIHWDGPKARGFVVILPGRREGEEAAIVRRGYPGSSHGFIARFLPGICHGFDGRLHQ